MHYYQHHIGDFIRDTSRLTDHQTIAYLRLIWLYYESEKPLENDIPMLAFKIGSDENTVEMLLKCYFNANALHWHHKRIDSEIEAYKNKSEKAKNSAEYRWKNTKAMRTHNDSNASAMLTSNQEPVTKNQEPVTSNNTHTQTREREDSKNVDNYVDNRFIVKDDLTLAKSDSRVVKNCRTLGLYIEDIDEVDFQQAYMAFLANNTGVRFGSEDAAILKFCSSYLRSAALQKFKRPREQEQGTESESEPSKPKSNRISQMHRTLWASDVSEQTWADWYELRSKKKAVINQTVIDGARAEAEKLGISLDETLKMWVLHGWQGFKAEWVLQEKNRQAPQQFKSAAERREERADKLIQEILAKDAKKEIKDVTPKKIKPLFLG